MKSSCQSPHSAWHKVELKWTRLHYKAKLNNIQKDIVMIISGEKRNTKKN